MSSYSQWREQFLRSANYHSYQQFGSNPMFSMGPLALVALPGSRSFVEKVNQHLYDRRLQYLESSPMSVDDQPGFLRDNYIVRSDSVRFSSGEGKATIRDSIRGHDVYILRHPEPQHPLQDVW